MKWKLKCDVCEDDFEDIDPNLQSCRKCQEIINKYTSSSQKKKKYPPEEVRKALNKSYSHKENDAVYFKCGYTGIIGRFNDNDETLGCFKDAFVLTLDHKYPNQKELVVSLNIINKMKCDIPLEEFKKLIVALADFYKKESEDEIQVKDSRALEMALREICSTSHEKEAP